MTESKKPKSTAPKASEPIDPLEVIKKTGDRHLREKGIDPECVRKGEDELHKKKKLEDLVKTMPGEQYYAYLAEACPLTPPTSPSQPSAPRRR